MKYAIVTEGTWGDVLPLFFIGKQLQAKGNEVTVFSNEYYKVYVEAQGMNFVATTSTSLRTEMLANKTLWYPIRGLFVVMKYVAQIFRTSYPVIKKVMQQKDGERYDAVIGYQLSLAGRAIAEKMNIPFFAICIAPIQVRSKYELPVIFGGVNPNKWPRLMRRYFHQVGDFFILNRGAHRYIAKINTILKSEALSPVTSLMTYTTAGQHVVGLWPEWYYKKYEDQENLYLAGFPLGVTVATGLDADLNEWITVDTKQLIVVTLGSGYVFEAELVAMLRTIAKALNERFVLLTPQASEYENDQLLYVAKNVDMNALLQNAKLFVHHGGAGSTVQAITNGVPSVVIPMSHDQPDNAYRVAQNGLGVVLPHATLTIKTLSLAITDVLKNEVMLEQCRNAQLRTSGEDGVVNTVDFIEGVVKKK